MKTLLASLILIISTSAQAIEITSADIEVVIKQQTKTHEVIVKQLEGK